MMALASDHHVDFRCEQDLAQSALIWRRAGQNENDPYFNIIDYVQNVLAKKLQKGPLHIKFFDARDGEKPAYVTYNPLTLHIDREIWELADIGDPEARFVVAHEIGHIILHDHNAKAFSIDPKDQIKYAESGHSAEWQANIFASYFLVPDRIMAAFPDLHDLTKSCAVNDPVTQQRHALFMEAQTRSVVKREGSFCIRCGNFSIMSNGRCASLGCGRMS